MNDLDRVLRSLNHPLRRRILRAVVDEARSASSLAEEFKMELGIVSYHLNVVLAKEHKIVELVHSVKKRGAREKFYCLSSDLTRCLSSKATRKGKGVEMSLEENVIALVLGIAQVGDIRTPVPSS